MSLAKALRIYDLHPEQPRSAYLVSPHSVCELSEHLLQRISQELADLLERDMAADMNYALSLFVEV